MPLSFHPLTPDRLADFERLFGPKGAYSGCWCMYWRLKRDPFEAGRKDGSNRTAITGIIQRGDAPGILAYEGDDPVGWCAVTPREATPVLNRSPVLKPVDDQPVWSITCFFVAKGYRRGGVMAGLLRAAVAYALQQGAQIVEGYPIEPRHEDIPDVYVYMGTVRAFKQAGFVEAARRSDSHPVMRYNKTVVGD
jgi:GNAT superfamily N-acetyltransferase